MKNVSINKIPNKILIGFLFIFIAACISYANTGILSPRLMEKAAELQSTSGSSAPSKSTIAVLFYPIGNNSDNIDLTFFNSNNIAYIKSDSFISADVPVSLIEQIENISGVEYADISFPPTLYETISEGRNSINATKFVLTDIAGEGVKIAVIDTGFAHYKTLQNKRELPQDLTTVDFTVSSFSEIDPNEGTEKHGSACAEIIYDIAPKAEMYLLKIQDITSFQNAYKYCRSKGINIVSLSLGWDPANINAFVDGTGIDDMMVDAATASNILTIVAAGNEANRSWFGEFEDSGPPEHFTKFPRGKDYLDINLMAGVNVYFMWDDFTKRETAYNLYVYDENSNEVWRSTYIPGNSPVITFPNKAGKNNLKLRIKKSSDIVNHRKMKLFFNRTSSNALFGYNPIVNIDDRNPASSLSSPADSKTALTVGAMNFSNYENGPIESYSSRGPVWINGNPVIKPEIVAPAGVTTVSCGRKNFSGTSAATPHVAGAAALLLSLDQTLSTNTANGKFKDTVIGYCKQVQSSPDNTYGYGKLILNSEIIPYNTIGDFVCYPNPVSISRKGYIKITNLPFNTSMVEIIVYTVTGEFVKSFSADDLVEEDTLKKRMIKWDLRNQAGDKIAPGVYFINIKTLLGGKHIKKIAIQK